MYTNWTEWAPCPTRRRKEDDPRSHNKAESLIIQYRFYSKSHLSNRYVPSTVGTTNINLSNNVHKTNIGTILVSGYVSLFWDRATLGHHLFVLLTGKVLMEEHSLHWEMGCDKLKAKDELGLVWHLPQIPEDMANLLETCKRTHILPCIVVSASLWELKELLSRGILQENADRMNDINEHEDGMRTIDLNDDHFLLEHTFYPISCHCEKSVHETPISAKRRTTFP